MAMTYKQAIDLTNKCGNNWKFDIFNYAVWKTKSFEKIIPIKDNMVIICKLDFRDVTENYKKNWGCAIFNTNPRHTDRKSYQIKRLVLLQRPW